MSGVKMPAQPLEQHIHRNNCPLCIGTVLKDLGAIGHRRLARCRRCNHRFVARCDDASLAEEYRSAYYSHDSDPRIAAWAHAHQRVWDAVIDQIVARHPTAGSLLDVGSGSGGFLLRLHARYPEMALAAVETAAAARTALARRLPSVEFPANNAELMDGVGDRFDIVTMLQTLEHLRDPLSACRGARHCLRPGGLLFVTVPNRRSLAVWRRGRGSDCYANGTHLQFFAKEPLYRLLHAAGFQRIRRIIGFGGGQHTALLPAMGQFAMRVFGWSTELRFEARRP